MLKIGSQFSGIGSFEVAMQQLNVPHRCIMAVEWDKYARQTYLANFGEPKHYYKDSYDSDYENVEQLDVFLSSPPCQAFSLAGKRLGESDKRGILFYETYRFIKVNKPKYFIIENVKGLLSTGTVFANWLELLGQSVNTNINLFNHHDSLMYNLHWTVLNAKNFGVPQNRERVFIIGIRNDLPNDFRFPIGEPLTKRLKDILEPKVDEKYYLSDNMINGFMNKCGGFADRFKPKTGNDIGVCLTARYHKMGIADNYIKEGYINQDTQASSVFSADGISPTVTAGTHGYALGYIKEPLCVAMRGREPQALVQKRTEFGKEVRKEYEAGNLKIERKNIQQLEPRTDGITNTITSVQKDNLIITNDLIKVGSLYDNNSDAGRIYSDEGISTTIKSEGGGGGAKTGLYLVTNLLIPVGNIESAFESNGRVYSDQGISKTINAGNGGGGEAGQRTGLYETQNRIRRLTPKECMRLMGFSDEFKQPVSDSQKYRQAGNTIVVGVLKAILKNLLNL